MSRATTFLGAFHLIGNALLLWLGYYWLGVGESTMGRLLWSGLLAILILCSALWLHGSAFAYFRFGDQSTIRPAVRAAIVHLAPLFVLAVVTLVVYAALAWWRDYSTQPALKIASWLTLKVRKPVKPATIQAGFNGVLWIVRWAIIPVLILPFASAVAAKGWHGFRGESRDVRSRWLYWVEVVALCVIGLWLPLKMITWVPGFHSFGIQMASFVVRLLLAYLIFTASLLLLEFVTSGGNPRVNQPRTVGAP
jgi:hypothetical protein